MDIIDIIKSIYLFLKNFRNIILQYSFLNIFKLKSHLK